MIFLPGIRSICVVEDNNQFRAALVDWLSRHGFNAVGYTDGQDFLNRWNLIDCDLILSDVHMPEMDGLQLLQDLPSLSPHTPVIMMSSSFDKTLPGICKAYGALAFLTKPFDGEELLAAMKKACR